MSKETDRNSNDYLKYAMRSQYVAVAALALAVLGASTPSQAQVGGIICDGRWHTVRSVDVTRQVGDFNSLNAVVALSSTDVWAVGQLERFAGTDYNHALVEHWDGTSWMVIPTPHPSMAISILFGVAALSSNDVWAVGYEEDLISGYRTLIEHWDGSAWTIVQDGTREGWLTSVTAIAPDDVWVVGSTNYVGQGLIEHWDGTAWTPVAPASTVGVLLGLASIGSNMELWSTGYRTKQNRYTGTLVQHLCTGQ